jgi:hypothetical protein
MNINLQKSALLRQPWLWLAVTIVLIVLVTWLSPIERTLGERVRLVYFHGAWVWAGKLAFAGAGAAGLIGLVTQRVDWQRASLALGRTGLLFWVTYLPMSLWVQQLNWGGIFWDEPRWKVPLALGVTAVLMHAGLTLMANLKLASAANLIFACALWYFLGNIENVLHPDSPIYSSEAIWIQVFFSLLLVLALLFGAQTARMFYRYQ